MADPTKVARRPCSERRLAANRANSRLSTGPVSTSGKARACMNNYRHGMRSTQLLLEGESPTEFLEHESAILGSLDPEPGVDTMLAQRIVRNEWFNRRGVKAITSRTSKTMRNIAGEADIRAQREVDRLAPLVGVDSDAVRQLRTFPAGVAYLLMEWSILLDRLNRGQYLLGSHRMRCFALLAKPTAGVLRNEPVATRWLRAQGGLMLGDQPTLEAVANYLGGHPPAGMSEAEFAVRVREFAESLLPREASSRALYEAIAETIAELRAHQVAIQEMAAWDLEDETGAAAVDATPAGISVANYIHANDRGIDAALRRLESRKKASHPGPTRGPKKPVAPADVSPTMKGRCAWSGIRNPSRRRATLEPMGDDDPGLPTAPNEANVSTVEPIADSTPDPASRQSNPLRCRPRTQVSRQSNPLRIRPRTPASRQSNPLRMSTPDPGFSTVEPIAASTPDPASRQSNPLRCRLRTRVSRQSNPLRCRPQTPASRQSNPLRLRPQTPASRQSNPLRRRLQTPASRQSNPLRCRLQTRVSRQSNPLRCRPQTQVSRQSNPLWCRPRTPSSRQSNPSSPMRSRRTAWSGSGRRPTT